MLRTVLSKSSSRARGCSPSCCCSSRRRAAQDKPPDAATQGGVVDDGRGPGPDAGRPRRGQEGPARLRARRGGFRGQGRRARSRRSTSSSRLGSGPRAAGTPTEGRPDSEERIAGTTTPFDAEGRDAARPLLRGPRAAPEADDLRVRGRDPKGARASRRGPLRSRGVLRRVAGRVWDTDSPRRGSRRGRRHGGGAPERRVGDARAAGAARRGGRRPCRHGHRRPTKTARSLEKQLIDDLIFAEQAACGDTRRQVRGHRRVPAAERRRVKASVEEPARDLPSARRARRPAAPLPPLRTASSVSPASTSSRGCRPRRRAPQERAAAAAAPATRRGARDVRPARPGPRGSSEEGASPSTRARSSRSTSSRAGSPPRESSFTTWTPARRGTTSRPPRTASRSQSASGGTRQRTSRNRRCASSTRPGGLSRSPRTTSGPRSTDAPRRDVGDIPHRRAPPGRRHEEDVLREGLREARGVTALARSAFQPGAKKRRSRRPSPADARHATPRRRRGRAPPGRGPHSRRSRFPSSSSGRASRRFPRTTPRSRSGSST